MEKVSARFVVRSPEKIIKNGCVIVKGDRIIDWKGRTEEEVSQMTKLISALVLEQLEKLGV